ncbi:MAG TPA: SpvB/TcaC N-terminal domain-containing protein, partial [Cellvibrionaceae bacterium]|nr:SpvB/TcaC N-terminal domain-containing protein [Cellvibrionaceae bacterium]
ALPNLDSAGLVAITNGEASVHNGQANYKINIDAPPVINNLKPNIALNYTSSNKSGLLGVGWSITGLSTIYRCHKNFANEGTQATVANPHFTKADRLCLDGKKLELVAATAAETVSDNDYWAPNAEYRTEIDTFNKIVAQGSSQEGGPASFIVYRKNGEIAHYGAQANSQSSRILVNAGPKNGVVRIWALDHVEDRYHNYYDVYYAQNTSEGEYHPSHIYWSNQSSLVFKYDLRDTQLGTYRPDIPSSFDAGAQFKTTYLLRDINTYIHAQPSSPDAGTAVKKYHIGYKRSVQTERYLIDTIQECGTAASTEECAKPLAFSWQQGDMGFSTTPLSLVTCSSGIKLDQFSISSDINNDGYVDLLYYDIPADRFKPDARRPWSYALGTASGCFSEPVSPSSV